MQPCLCRKLVKCTFQNEDTTEISDLCKIYLEKAFDSNQICSLYPNFFTVKAALYVYESTLNMELVNKNGSNDDKIKTIRGEVGRNYMGRNFKILWFFRILRILYGPFLTFPAFFLVTTFRVYRFQNDTRIYKLNIIVYKPYRRRSGDNLFSYDSLTKNKSIFLPLYNH